MTTTKRLASSPPPGRDPRARARELGLWGLVANWDEVRDEPWLDRLLDLEEGERHRRSLERRVRNARLGRFRPLADFDWSWPKKIDRAAVEDLFQLGFLDDQANVVMVGPNGVGKTTLAKNLVHQALLEGCSALWTTASDMLNDLTRHEGTALTRRLRRYTRPAVLAVDEVGYLSYGSRHADLLFEIVSRRHQEKSTVLTTNRPFAEWNEVFPQSSCVVALVDRLVHRAEIVQIEGDSYRLKEAKERATRKRAQGAPRARPQKRKPKASDEAEA